MCLKWYLLGCLLIVVSTALCEVYAPKTFLASNLEYVVEPAIICVIYSDVGPCHVH